MRRFLLAIAVALAPSAGAAGSMVEGIVEDHVLPGYRALASETQVLSASAR